MSSPQRPTSLIDSFGTTVAQRSSLSEQLHKAQQEVKEALFTLALVHHEVLQESELLRCCLEQAMNVWGTEVIGDLIHDADFAGKSAWQEEWGYEWVDSDNDQLTENTVKHSARSAVSKHHTTTHSMAPPTSSSPNILDKPQASGSGGNTHTDDPPIEQDNQAKPMRYDYNIAKEFTNMFGSVMYNPIPPPFGPSRAPSPRRVRRLQRDRSRISSTGHGGPAAADMQLQTEAKRVAAGRIIRDHHQAQGIKGRDLELDLWDITTVGDQDQASTVDWSHCNEIHDSNDDEALMLENPFNPPN